MTFRPRYGLLALVWLGSLYWLSSRPDLSTTEQSGMARIVSNLMHAPLFAGLAFFCLKSISGRTVSWSACGVVVLVCAACGALLEWHQSFVPGRQASVNDLLMDLLGTCAMLLILRVRALRGADPQSPGRGFHARA
jgi:VanZ family protein